jgi:CHAD domain-containing protein
MRPFVHRYHLFRKRLDAFVHQLPLVAQGSVEGLHRARVASRRLRELIPLLTLDRETTRHLTRRLRKVTKQLGAVRELDVLMLLLDELRRDSRYSPAALKQVGAAVVQARVTACARVAIKLPTAKLERLADRLVRAGASVKADDSEAPHPGAHRPTRAWLWALDARLARRAARSRTAIEAAGALYLPEPLHDVRIALKKLRYTAELSRRPERPRKTADLAALKAAQALLGRLHDLEVLIAWARELQASLSPPNLTAWRELGALVHAVEPECRQLHARYMRDRSKLIAIADRMGADQLRVAGTERRATGA